LRYLPVRDAVLCPSQAAAAARSVVASRVPLTLTTSPRAALAHTAEVVIGIVIRSERAVGSSDFQIADRSQLENTVERNFVAIFLAEWKSKPGRPIFGRPNFNCRRVI
jgi:hypothetical protein